MKSYYKIVVFIGIIWIVAIIVFVIITGQMGDQDQGRAQDIVRLNDIVKDAEDNLGDFSELGKEDYGAEYVIVNSVGEVMYSSDPGYSGYVGTEGGTGSESGSEEKAVDTDGAVTELTVETAIKRNYPYRPVIAGDRVSGYVILTDDGSGTFDTMRIIIAIAMVAIGIVFLIAAICYGSYVRRRIYIPFQNMKNFAGRIAGGNLDDPLMMDKDNMFGAFTESFDIMRDELRASKQRETELQKREKELIASLSHDLKTPVTGIKLICEVLSARLSMDNTYIDPADLSDKVKTVYEKADQIDMLVTDLLSSTMEELNELKVSCTDETSGVLSDIIKKYDDRELVSMGTIPEVVIHTDVKRMSQVIGNLISNSYKYAGTEIHVSFRLVDDYLEMMLEDSGPGVPEDELELITNKFYRGRQWVESSQEGSGLGLYISKLLMEKMDGELVPKNTKDGFAVVLLIALS